MACTYYYFNRRVGGSRRITVSQREPEGGDAVPVRVVQLLCLQKGSGWAQRSHLGQTGREHKRRRRDFLRQKNVRQNIRSYSQLLYPKQPFIHCCKNTVCILSLTALCNLMVFWAELCGLFCPAQPVSDLRERRNDGKASVEQLMPPSIHLLARKVKHNAGFSCILTLEGASAA